jgi:hypothetical protein
LGFAANGALLFQSEDKRLEFSWHIPEQSIVEQSVAGRPGLQKYPMPADLFAQSFSHRRAERSGQKPTPQADAKNRRSFGQRLLYQTQLVT